MRAKSVLLCGLQPQPLSTYLCALGVLRICSKQLNAAIRGGFSAAGFRLEGIDDAGLVSFLLGSWSPSPVLTPWNNASGFYDSSKGRMATSAIESVLASGAARFVSLQRAVKQVRTLVTEAGYTEAPEKEEKAAFIASLRDVLPDDAVAWLDAAAIVEDADARMMPLLGSGGNEGVLDYSGLFLRSIVDTLLGDEKRSLSLLRAALFGEHTAVLFERPGGQFDPGTAGGFNTGPGFESKDLPNNPWIFQLLIEGSIAWASGLASRQQGATTKYRFAVSPFTVRHRAAGYGSAATSDESQRVRAEVWVPIWNRPAGYAEVERFISEGRADVRGRGRRAMRATDSLDFVDAIASLGVDRGVSSFVRYALIKRRGDSYIALPAGTLEVGYRREVDLVRQLGPELELADGFLARFPSEQGPPALLAGLRRAIDEARFDVAARGGPDSMVRLVRAVGAFEMALAKRDPTKEPKLARPLGRLSPDWIDACGDSAEVRIAAAVASIGETGAVSRMRTYLAPLDQKVPARYAPGARVTAWVGADLSDRLSHVLLRRLRDARSRASISSRASGNPTWGAYTAALEDVAAFLSPDMVDDRALEELLFGFTWIAYDANISVRKPVLLNPPLPRMYALLKLLVLTTPLVRGAEKVLLTAHPALLPLLRAGRVSAAVELATKQLAAKGFAPRRVVERQLPDDGAFGRRLGAALLIPVLQTDSLASAALIRSTDTASNDVHAQETIDAN